MSVTGEFANENNNSFTNCGNTMNVLESTAFSQHTPTAYENLVSETQSQLEETVNANKFDLKLIVELYRQEIRFKMENNTLIDWPLHNDEILKQFQRGDLLPKSISVENHRIVVQELAKELEHLKNTQKSVIGSIDRTISNLGEKQRNKFYTEFEKYLTHENLGAMKELAIAVSNSMIHVELKRLEKSIGKNVKFFKTLLEHEMTSCLHSIDQLAKAVDIFEGIMNNEINSATSFRCYSNAEFQLLINRVLNIVKNQFLGDTTVNTQFFTNILTKFVAVDFEKVNMEIQSTEREIHSQVLENYYRSEMHKFLADGIRRESEVTFLHQKLVRDILKELQSTGISQKLGLQPENILSKINIEFNNFNLLYGPKEKNIEDDSKTLKSIVAHLQSEFNCTLSQEVSHKILTDKEYNISYEKLKNEYMQKLSNEVKTVRHKEKIDDILIGQIFEKMLEECSAELKLENSRKILSQRKKATSFPIVAVNFQEKFTQVGILQESGNFQKVPFENNYAFKNVITFLKNKYLVGISGHTEKIGEVSIKDVIENNNCRIPGNFKCKITNEKFPLDFKLIVSLIFIHVRESCENFKNATYENIVVSVPIWFGSIFRQDIKDAAILSGFKQVFLINDTSAVALQFFKSRIHHSDQSDQFEKQHQLVVVTADSEKCSSAVYSLKKNSVISMTTNFGDCHLTNWLHKWKCQSIHVSVIQEILGGKKYGNAIVVCKNEKLARECAKVLDPDIKGSVQVDGDMAVLQGVGYFALLLTQNPVTANQMLEDKTFYDLSIDSRYLRNKKVINRLTCCQPHEIDVLTFEMQHRFKNDCDTLRIYECGNELLKTRFPVKILRGKHNEEINVKFFVNSENIYSVGSPTMSMDPRESQNEVVESYRKIIKNNFVSDKELQLAKNT